MYYTLSAFYTGREWKEFRQVIIAQRTRADGFIYDEITGKPIVKAYDIILHHKTPLTLENVNNAEIALNPDNIQVVSFRTHNALHDRYGTYTRHIYLVYGSPLSGKSTYVKECAGLHDIVIDRDKIYAGITNNPLYIKPDRLYDNMLAVERALLDCIKYKRGKWVNCFIVGGFPYKGERERMATEYGAEEIFIDCDIDTALARLECCNDSRDKKEWRKHIEKWFMQYGK